MSITKQITILVTQFFFCTVCFAQQQVDSLKTVLPLLHDSEKVDCLNALGGIYIKFIRDTLGYCGMPLSETNTLQSFSSEASHYAALANEKALKINYIHGIAESLSYQAEIENLSGNFLTEEKLCREAIDWYRKTLNKKRLAETHFLLGHSLYAQSFFIESIKNFDTAYEWHRKNGNIVGMYWTLTVSGAVYHESGNYEKAFELARKCLDIAIQNNNDWFRRGALADIGWLYQDIEDYKTALEYYRLAGMNVKKDALAFAEFSTLLHQYDSAKYYYSLVDTSDQGTLRFYLTSIGEYYFEQKQYDKALPNFLRGLKHHQQLNDSNQIMHVLLDIAKTYLTFGNNDSAFKYANENLSIAKQTGAKQFIRDASEILFSVYDHWRQSDSAYFYYSLYAAMKDSVLNDHVKGKLAAYTFEQKMELLNKEKQIQQVQLQKESLLKNILIGGVIVLLLLGMIIFRNIMLKRKSEVNRRELAENELQIQKLESEKKETALHQQATELEMQALRAQMNPHFIFNSLNSINRFILKKQSSEATEYLTKFSRLIRMILNNSVSASVSLADDLEALQLYLELERLRCEEKISFKIKVDPNLDTDFMQAPPMLLQPFIENAIWHGLMNKEGNGHLSINIQQENLTLICLIADDGIGRKKATELKDKSGKHKSMGMKITESRIAMMQKMNGTDKSIEIKDLVDTDGSAAGTEVVLKIPIAQQA